MPLKRRQKSETPKSFFSSGPGAMLEACEMDPTTRQWLLKLEMPYAYLQEVLSEHLLHLEYLEHDWDHLDEEIGNLAESDIYAPFGEEASGLEGIQTWAAMVLIAEITDFRRFLESKSFDGFSGVDPFGGYLGDKRKGGPITRRAIPVSDHLDRGSSALCE